MSDRQRLSKDDDLDRARHARPPVGRQPTEADSILDLQGIAGNQAVASMLGRDAAAPGPATVQRDEKGAGEKGEASAPGTMTIPEMKLAVPIQSLQQQIRRPTREKEPGGDVIVTFSEKDLDPRLMNAVRDGKPFATITIQVRTVTITLTNVFISGIQMSGGTVTLQLNAAGIEFPKEGPPSEEERGY